MALSQQPLLMDAGKRPLEEVFLCIHCKDVRDISHNSPPCSKMTPEEIFLGFRTKKSCASFCEALFSYFGDAGKVCTRRSACEEDKELSVRTLQRNLYFAFTLFFFPFLLFLLLLLHTLN